MVRLYLGDGRDDLATRSLLLLASYLQDHEAAREETIILDGPAFIRVNTLFIKSFNKIVCHRMP